MLESVERCIRAPISERRIQRGLLARLSTTRHRIESALTKQRQDLRVERLRGSGANTDGPQSCWLGHCWGGQM